jgi:quinoprotein glucose dehydrogenase
MTYSASGRQYVVLAAGGHALYQTTPGDYVLAWALKTPSP